MDNTTQGLITAAQLASQAKSSIITTFIIALLVFIACLTICSIVRYSMESKRRAYEVQRRREANAKAEAQADADFYAYFGRATR